MAFFHFIFCFVEDDKEGFPEQHVGKTVELKMDAAVPPEHN